MIRDERLVEFTDNPTHYNAEVVAMAKELQYFRSKPVAGVEVKPLDDTQITHDIGVWTMVPVRPTERMIEAGKSADDELLAEPPGFYTAEEIYKAMIEAAPKAPFKPDLFSEPISLPAQEPAELDGRVEIIEQSDTMDGGTALTLRQYDQEAVAVVYFPPSHPWPEAVMTDEMVERAAKAILYDRFGSDADAFFEVVPDAFPNAIEARTLFARRISEANSEARASLTAALDSQGGGE